MQIIRNSKPRENNWYFRKKMKENCKWLTIFSITIENDFILIISFPHYCTDGILSFIFIISLSLKVNIRVVLIIMIIGSHGKGKMNIYYFSGIVLGAVHALLKILQWRNVKDRIYLKKANSGASKFSIISQDG